MADQNDWLKIGGWRVKKSTLQKIEMYWVGESVIEPLDEYSEETVKRVLILQMDHGREIVIPEDGVDLDKIINYLDHDWVGWRKRL